MKKHSLSEKFIGLGAAMLLAGALAGQAALPRVAAAESGNGTLNIEVLGAGAGGRGYVYAHVLSEIINKRGPNWIKSTASPTRGHVENILLTYKNPQKRANTVLYTGDIVIDAARLGKWEFKEKIQGLKLIANTFVGVWYIQTTDPAIKKWSDLAGKSVATDKAGSSKSRYFMDMFAQSGFTVKEVKITMNAARDSLIAGQVDAMTGSSVYTGDEPEHHAVTVELLARKQEKHHFVTIPREVVEKAAAATGIRYRYAEFPAKSLSPWQTEPVGGFVVSNMWGVWPEFPDAGVTAIVKTLHENTEEFRQYNIACRGLTKDNIAWLNILSLDEVHPAAMAYYKEKGIKIGIPVSLGK